MAITPVFESYTDKSSSVTFTKDDSYKYVDFSSYVSSDANAAVVECRNSLARGSGNSRSWYYYATSWGIGNAKQNIVQGNSSTPSVIPLDGSQKAYVRGQDSNLDVYVTGEFTSPGSYWHATPYNQTPTTQAKLGAWYNMGVHFGTLCIPEDIEAVVMLNMGTTANVGDLGIRNWGSTATWLMTSDQHERPKWFVCKVTPYIDLFALFQLYASGKYTAGPPEVVLSYSDWFQLGFIYKGYGLHGIDTTTDEGLSDTASAWELDGVSASDVPTGAIAVIGPMRSAIANPHGLREDGSTNGTQTHGFSSQYHGSYHANLNASDEYEDYVGATNGLWLFAYTDAIAEITATGGEANWTTLETGNRALLYAGADAVLDADGATVALVDGGVDVVLDADGQTAAATSADVDLVAVVDALSRAPALSSVFAVLDADGDSSAAVDGDGTVILDADGETVAATSADVDVVVTATGLTIGTVAAGVEAILTAAGLTVGTAEGVVIAAAIANGTTTADVLAGVEAALIATALGVAPVDAAADVVVVADGATVARVDAGVEAVLVADATAGMLAAIMAAVEARLIAAGLTVAPASASEVLAAITTARGSLPAAGDVDAVLVADATAAGRIAADVEAILTAQAGSVTPLSAGVDAVLNASGRGSLPLWAGVNALLSADASVAARVGGAVEAILTASGASVGLAGAAPVLALTTDGRASLPMISAVLARLVADASPSARVVADVIARLLAEANTASPDIMFTALVAASAVLAGTLSAEPVAPAADVTAKAQSAKVATDGVLVASTKTEAVSSGRLAVEVFDALAAALAAEAKPATEAVTLGELDALSPEAKPTTEPVATADPSTEAGSDGRPAVPEK